MNQVVLDFIQRLAALLESQQDQLVIDADTHATDLASLTEARRKKLSATPDYYHGRPVSAEDLVREMDMSGVDLALTWQNPSATPYTANPDSNTELLLQSNRYVLDSAIRHFGRFIPGGWTDPKACGVENALKIVDTCVREFGFSIVKMNPAQNHYRIDSPEVLRVVDRIVELGAIPAFHFGADTSYTPAEGLDAVASRHPEHPLLAVHMGGGGAGYEAAEILYSKARKLGLSRPNIRFALSAKRDTHMESDFITYQLAGEPFCRNLLCASDAPYGRMSWNFGGFRAMLDTLVESERHTDARVRENSGLFTPEIGQRYLGGNCARLVLDGYKRVLEAGKLTIGVCN